MLREPKNPASRPRPSSVRLLAATFLATWLLAGLAFAVPLKRDKYVAAMTNLLGRNTGMVEVVRPDKIDQNGQLPGDGMTAAVANLPAEFKWNDSDDALRSAAKSPDGTYCAGFILQVLSDAYDKTFVDSGNPAPATRPARLPFTDRVTANRFVDRWYLTSPEANDTTKPEYRGIVAAAELLGNTFEVRTFRNPTANNRDANLCTAAAGWTGLADAKTEATTHLQKFDLLQTWLPSTLSPDAQMAHTAVYVGHGWHAPAGTTSGPRKVYLRVYYWSTHYENIRTAPAALADPATVEVPANDMKGAAVEPARRVGYSYVDVPTGITVPGTDPMPGDLKLRPAKAVFATCLKFE